MVPYNYDFVCTYHLMDDDDPEMANFLYQVQLTTAFCMERHLFSMMCDKNPATNMFDSNRIQTVFNYLVHVMKLHENKKFVDVIREHPLVALYKRNKNLDEKDAEPDENDTENVEMRDCRDSTISSKCDPDNDKQLINDSLLWLISFHSFHAFHRCMIDVFTSGSAQNITDESLSRLKKTFETFESLESLETL